MLRKSILFFAALTIFASVEAFAVPSVRKLGTGTSTSANTAKPTVVLPKAQTTSSGETLQAKAAAASKASTSDANARLAGVGSLKTITVGNLTSLTGGSSGTVGTTLPVISGVVESGTGNYVTSLSMRSDNKLEVEKTNLLYAPVRNNNSDTVVGTVEIWLVNN